MNERETSELWKQAILAKLYERQPRPIDVAVDDANVTVKATVPDENELFDATVDDLRRDGLITYSTQRAPAGMTFDAKLTASGIKHYEKTYLSAGPNNAPILAALDRIRDILIGVATGGPEFSRSMESTACSSESLPINSPPRI